MSNISTIYVQIVKVGRQGSMQIALFPTNVRLVYLQYIANNNDLL